MVRSAAVVWSCLCLVAPAARADDTHYQNQLLGERALGMGGAFTAVASDPTASFYNPGGLAMSLPSSVSASLNVYGVEHRVVEGGFVSRIEGETRNADLENLSYPTIPTTFGVLRTVSLRQACVKSLAAPRYRPDLLRGAQEDEPWHGPRGRRCRPG